MASNETGRVLTERDWPSQAPRMAAHGLTVREWNRFEKILVQNYHEFGGLSLRHAKQILRECVNEFLEAAANG